MCNHAIEKWKKEYVVTYSKSKRLSIIIWRAIFGGGRAPLFEINRDPNSARNGYSVELYLETLEKSLPQITGDNRIFIQDNTPIHIANIIKN